MRADLAANSASAVALARAIESGRPSDSRLFADPFAVSFLAPLQRALVKLCGVPVLGGALLAIPELVAPGIRANTLGRTRFIDDVMLAAVESGIDQLLILGAGYDCRPYRFAAVSRVPIFEVDHPATQARKRTLLAQVLPAIPPNVAFVPVDFNRQSLAGRVTDAGFRVGCRNFFIWEGVTEYLSQEAVDATFRFVVESSAVGSEIVFTYTDAGLIDGTREFPGGRRLLAMNRLGGEPYTFGLDPTALRGYLAERNLELLEDIAGIGYATRYWKPLGRRLRGNEYERAVHARVRTALGG